MLNRQDVETTLTKLLARYIEKHGRLVDWSIFDCTAINNKRGIFIDPIPFVGKVVHYNEQMMIVKTKSTEYMAVALDYVTCRPKRGTKVLVTPYARRQFGGTRCDRYEAEIQGDNIKHYVITQEALYPMDPTYFPIDNLHSKSNLFKNLIKNMQTLFAHHGLRNLVHILVDANAKNFKFVDPVVNYGGSYPYMECEVNTQKYKGLVKIWIYDNGHEFGISFSNGNCVLGSENRIPFEQLGERLEERIDDGKWRKIKINILN